MTIENAADLNRSWDHAEARNDIGAIIGDGQGRTFEDQADLLGEELTGKAICLGYWGSPGTRGDADYDLGDPYGGYWGVSTLQDEKGFTTEVWHGSEIEHTQTTPGPVDTLEVGTSHGLNLALDGPA